MNTTSERATPLRRPSLVDRLNAELVLRDIEAAFDDYVGLLAWTRPGPGTRGWRRRLRLRVDGLKTADDAADLLDEMLVALDAHEFGKADPGDPG